jgi:hypothetical protein
MSERCYWLSVAVHWFISSLLVTVCHHSSHCPLLLVILLIPNPGLNLLILSRNASQLQPLPRFSSLCFSLVLNTEAGPHMGTGSARFDRTQCPVPFGLFVPPDINGPR